MLHKSLKSIKTISLLFLLLTTTLYPVCEWMEWDEFDDVYDTSINGDPYCRSDIEFLNMLIINNNLNVSILDLPVVWEWNGIGHDLIELHLSSPKFIIHEINYFNLARSIEVLSITGTDEDPQPIESLPYSFVSNTSLVVLYINNTLLNDLNPYFQSLSTLRVLDIRNNNLSVLPSITQYYNGQEYVFEFNNMWWLESVWLGNNNLFCENGSINEDLIPNLLIDGTIPFVDGVYEQNCEENLSIVDVPVEYNIEELTAYPNPFNPTTTIKVDVPFENKIYDLRIYNIMGQTVLSKTITNSTEFKFNGSELSSGTYIISLQYNNKIISNKKISLLK